MRASLPVLALAALALAFVPAAHAERFVVPFGTGDS